MTDNIPLDDLQGASAASASVEMESSNQPRYRRNKTRPSSSYGLGSSVSSAGTRARHSYHVGDADTLSKELINQLPSKQLAKKVKHVMGTEEWRDGRRSRRRRPGYNTVRFTGDAVAQELADQLMDDPAFADEPDALQTEDIRNQYPATSLETKMKIKKNVEKKRKTKNKSKKPGAFKRARYSLSLSWRNLKDEVAEVMYSLELWKSHFKAIEGHFGTSVTSYFRFIKWLFLLNIPVFLLTLAFVITPQLLYRYIELDGYKNNTEDFSAEDILTGSGWLNETELYYGSYTHETIEISYGYKYHMIYAYLLTVFGYYLLVIVATMHSLSQSYKRNYIESGDEFSLYYVTKVFSGWDHSINDPKAALLKHKSLFKEFQEYLSSARHDDVEQTWRSWCAVFWTRAFTNLLVVCILVGCGYVVWFIGDAESLENDVEVLNVMALPLCVTAINFIIPFAFSILATFERYKQPKNELYITMVRTILLNVATLGVLVYFWFTRVECSDTEARKWTEHYDDCRECWETFMGEEIYRLVIVDFIFILVVTFLSEFCRRLMSQYCCKSLGYPEFNIARNTLNLIYSQILVWIGTFYCPMLSFIHIIKLFIIFYVKRVSVTQNCVPSVKPWRGGRTHTVILGLLFAALLLSIFSVGYSIAFLTPSPTCGPYREYNETIDVIRDQFDDWSENNPDTEQALTIIIETLTSTFFVVALFIVLCVLAHWSRVVARGHEEMAKLVKHQINLEGKDLLFLLKLLGRVNNYKSSQGGSGSNPPPQSSNQNHMQGAVAANTTHANSHLTRTHQDHNNSSRNHMNDGHMDARTDGHNTVVAAAQVHNHDGYVNQSFSAAHDVIGLQ